MAGFSLLLKFYARMTVSGGRGELPDETVA
jgi:hypothetical protein